MIVMCKNCKNVQRVPCRPGLGGAIVPRSCNHIPQVYISPIPLMLPFFITFSCLVLFSTVEINSRDWDFQPGEEPCPLDPWVVVPDKSKYVDQQTLKLQENPEVMMVLTFKRE